MPANHPHYFNVEGQLTGRSFSFCFLCVDFNVGLDVLHLHVLVYLLEGRAAASYEHRSDEGNIY